MPENLRARRRLRRLTLALGGALALGLGLGGVEAVQPAGASPAAAAQIAHPVQMKKGGFVLYKPKMTGGTRVSSKFIRAIVKTSGSVAPKLTYRWYRGSKPIGGATKSRYRLKVQDAGHRVSVKVHAAAKGYPSVTKFSRKSAKVRLRSIDNPKSIYVVVNKQRPLYPKSYVPKGMRMPKSISNTNGQPVRAETAKALERMAKAARKDGLNFQILSGYRSYGLQKQLFNGYVAQSGRKAAELTSARPGYSEHQTGLAVDLGQPGGCGLSTCFAKTSISKWIRKHGAKYGFILRYPKGYTHVTGFEYEPWHFRYVGPKTAKAMKKKGIKTLEGHRGLKAARNY